MNHWSLQLDPDISKLKTLSSIYFIGLYNRSLRDLNIYDYESLTYHTTVAS